MEYTKEERARRYRKLRDAGVSREDAIKLRDASPENYERALKVLLSYKVEDKRNV